MSAFKVVASCCLFACLLWTGCEPSGAPDVAQGEDGSLRVGPAEEVAEVPRSVVPGERKLIIDGFRGDVMLEGVAVQSADLQFLKRGYGADAAEAREHLNGISVTEQGTADTYTYRLEADDADRAAVDVTGTVPAGTPVEVKHESGAVSIAAVEAPIRVRHQHGQVQISKAAAEVDVAIKNGDVRVSLVTVPRDAKINLRTANGDVELALPPDASVQVDAQTQAGEVFVRGLTFDPQRLTPLGAGSRYTAQHGAGDAVVTLRTENGSILLRAAADTTIARPDTTETSMPPADSLAPPTSPPADTASPEPTAPDTAAPDTASPDTASPDTTG